jgi:hypothetical protein
MQHKILNEHDIIQEYEYVYNMENIHEYMGFLAYFNSIQN